MLNEVRKKYNEMLPFEPFVTATRSSPLFISPKHGKGESIKIYSKRNKKSK